MTPRRCCSADDVCDAHADRPAPVVELCESCGDYPMHALAEGPRDEMWCEQCLDREADARAMGDCA